MRTLPWKTLAAGGVALLGPPAAATAQAPGPAVRISRVVAVFDERRPLVTRGLAPEDRPPPAPPGWLAGPTSTAVRPLTSAEQAAAASVAPVRKPSLAESTFSGVKSFIAPPGQPPTPTPLPQGMLPPAAQYPSQGSPGVYAGPPAYRWYGYGAVTPGRNPHAPDGKSPHGSANWYAQSGATPGAFPVTVTASGEAASGQPRLPAELPSYTTGNVAASISGSAEPPAPTASAPPPAFAPDPSQPLPVTATAAVEPVSLTTRPPEPTPLPLMPTPVALMPTPVALMPVAMPTPLAPEPARMSTVTPPPATPSVTPPPRLAEPAGSAPTAAAPAPGGAGPQPLLTWSSPSTDPAVTFTGSKPAALALASAAPVSPPPAATVTPVAVTAAPVSPAVVPAAAAVPVPAPAPAVVAPVWGAAVKPLGRSQGPTEAGAPTLEQAVRSAAAGFATVVELRHTGPSTVVVRLRAATPADARSAAELVSGLPALKAYAVDFLVAIAK